MFKDKVNRTFAERYGIDFGGENNDITKMYAL